MNETQARQAFNAAQTKVEEALRELDKARRNLESIEGHSVTMNHRLANTFSQLAASSNGPVLADF